MNETRFRSIATDAAYEEAATQSRSEVVLIYKHSALCELSAVARKEMVHLSKSEDLPVYEVVVQTARPLSNRIAQQLNIRHESPQLIVLKNETPVFHTSHLGVTARKVGSAISQLA